MITYYDELREWLDLYEYVNQVKDFWLKTSDLIGDDDKVYDRLYSKFFEEDYVPTLGGASIRSRMYRIYPAYWRSTSSNSMYTLNAWFKALDKASEEIKKILKNNEKGI